MGIILESYLTVYSVMGYVFHSNEIFLIAVFIYLKKIQKGGRYIGFNRAKIWWDLCW
jgi:hypothetical protein